jgi:hypothetical protein
VRIRTRFGPGLPPRGQPRQVLDKRQARSKAPNSPAASRPKRPARPTRHCLVPRPPSSHPRTSDRAPEPGPVRTTAHDTTAGHHRLPLRESPVPPPIASAPSRYGPQPSAHGPVHAHSHTENGRPSPTVPTSDKRTPQRSIDPPTGSVIQMPRRTPRSRRPRRAKAAPPRPDGLTCPDLRQSIPGPATHREPRTNGRSLRDTNLRPNAGGPAHALPPMRYRPCATAHALLPRQQRPPGPTLSGSPTSAPAGAILQPTPLLEARAPPARTTRHGRSSG